MNPRQRILETTAYLFHHQGYNNTGINQIIQEAKVAKASFYHHFTSKEDLCIEYLNKRHKYWFNSLNEYTSTAVSSSEKILRSFDFLIYMNDKEDFRGCSFLNILSEISREHKLILEVIRSHKKDLLNYFSELAKNDEQASHLYLLFEGSIVESQMYRSNEMIIRSKKITKNLI